MDTIVVWADSSVVECLPKDQYSLRFNCLCHGILLWKWALHIHLAPAAYISIMLLRPVKKGAKCTAETTNKCWPWSKHLCWKTCFCWIRLCLLHQVVALCCAINITMVVAVISAFLPIILAHILSGIGYENE